MTAAGITPDAWKEVCLISVIPEGGSAISFCTLTEDITGMEWMDKEFDGITNVCGGNIAKYTMTAKESITLKVYPVDALLDNSDVAQGVVQMFHPQSTEDTTQPILVDNTLTRNKHGLIFLWAETLPASAQTVPDISKTAYRIQMINAYMTGYKLNYDDKILNAEITFSWTPFQQDGSANKREESTNGVQQLPAAITSATSF